MTCGHIAQLISQLALKPGEEEIKKKGLVAILAETEEEKPKTKTGGLKIKKIYEKVFGKNVNRINFERGSKK